MIESGVHPFEPTTELWRISAGQIGQSAAQNLIRDFTRN